MLMVRGTTQPAIPKSHEEESERADQQQRIDNENDEVIHQHQDHDHHLHPPASDDNIPEINRQEATEKPYASDREEQQHHTKINSILRNELLDQLHQQRQAGMVHLRTTERGGGRGGRQGAMGDELLTLYSSRKEITMGICAAFSVFLIIFVVFVVRLHRTRQPVVDKETLIDNEADVGFLPPPSSFSDSQSQTTVHV